MKKRVFILMLAGIMTVAAFTGCSLKGDEAAITVDDTEITADVANFYARYTQAQYETYYSAYIKGDMWKSDASEGENYEESVKSSIQQGLEDMVLLEKHMGDYKVSLSDAEKKVIADTAQKFDDDNSLEDKEKVSGEKKTVERVLTLMAVRQKMKAAIEKGADTKVSDEEAAQKSMEYVLFSYNPEAGSDSAEALTEEEKREMKEKAQSFAQSLKDGGNFSKLAKKAGVEVQKATFDSESQTPNADLVKAADTLKKGEFTDVIETDAGCYVAKLTSLLDRDATDARKDTIVSERKTKLYNDTCEKLRKEAKIKVHKGVWKKIDFNDLTVTMKVKEEVPYTDGVKTDDEADLDAEEENTQE